MKVTIQHFDTSNTFGYKMVSEDGKTIKNEKTTPFGVGDFDEDHLEKILSQKDFEDFQSGKEFQFDIPDWKISLIKGRSIAPKTMQKREVLKWYSDWIN